MHKRYSAIALCSAAAAIAGCGSSANSSSNPNGHGAANNPVFVTELNALCKSGNAAVAAAATSNPAKVVSIINQYLPKFKALSTQSATVEATFQKYLANIEAEAAALVAKNSAGIQAAKAKNVALAKQLGAPACAG